MLSRTLCESLSFVRNLIHSIPFILSLLLKAYPSTCFYSGIMHIRKDPAILIMEITVSEHTFCSEKNIKKT